MDQPLDPLQQATAGPASEEVEVWWGGYSPRALIPEAAFTLLLTAIVVAIWWFLFPDVWPHVTVMPSVALLWLIQLVRWGRVFFGRAYRLTNRRVYVQAGFDNTKALTLNVGDIKEIEIKQ